MNAVSLPRRPWERERLALGYAGLIPFVVCLGLILSAEEGQWAVVAAEAMRHYAAVIASFLGAVHWGAAASAGTALRRARLRWGVVPALAAWALLAVPVAFAFVGFALLFAVVLMVDRYLLPLLDDDYRDLRLRLSLIAVATLTGAALAVPAT